MVRSLAVCLTTYARGMSWFESKDAHSKARSALLLSVKSGLSWFGGEKAVASALRSGLCLTQAEIVEAEAIAP